MTPFTVNMSFKGYFNVIAASILYGSIGIFIKLISDMPLGSIIFYRLLFGLSAIIMYLAISGRLHEMRLTKKKSLLLMLGLFEAAAVLANFYSIRYTTVSIAVLLLYTTPVYVTLLSPIVLKEKITSSSIIALLLAVTGVVLVVQPGMVNGINIPGVALGLASGVLFALMILTSRRIKDIYSGTAQAMWSMIVSLIIFSPFALAVNTELVEKHIPVLMLFGLIPTAAGGILYFSGLRLIRAQSASIISLLEPVSAVILAFIILGEPLTFTTLLGGGFILIGAGLSGRDNGSGQELSADLRSH